MKSNFLATIYIIGFVTLLVLSYFLLSDVTITTSIILYLVISKLLIIPVAINGLVPKSNKLIKFIPILQEWYLFGCGTKAILHFGVYTIILVSGISWFFDVTSNIIFIMRFFSLGGLLLANIIDGILLNTLYKPTASKLIIRVLIIFGYYIPVARILSLTMSTYRRHVNV